MIDQYKTVKVELELGFPEFKLLFNYYIQAEKGFAASRNYLKAEECKNKAALLAQGAFDEFGAKLEVPATRERD